MEADKQHSKKSRLIGFLLSLGTLALWVVVLWHLLIFELRPALYALTGLMALLVVLARFLPQKFREQFFKARDFVFYGVGFCGLLPLFHLAFLTQSALTSALCVAAALIAFAFASKPMTGILAGLFCVVIPLIGDIPIFTIVSLIYSVLFFLAAWKRPSWIKNRIPIFFLLCVLALSTHLHHFYKGQPLDESKKILLQQGVKSIYLSSDSVSPLTTALGYGCRLVVENCDGSLILGGRERRRGLYLYRDGNLSKTLVRQVSDYIDLDCENDIIWVGEFHKSMIRGLDTQTGTTDKRILGIPFGGLSRVRLNKKQNRIYASRDDTPRILQLDLRTEKPLVAQFQHPVIDFDFFNEVDALFVAHWGGIFYRYGLTSLEKQEKLITPDWLIHFCLNKQDLVGYITKFYSGKVLKVNLSTLEVMKKIELEPGLRFPLYDRKRNVLFVSNFITGQCHALDGKTLREKDSRNFGARLRATSLSNDGKTLYAPSAQGAFSWDLSTLNK